MIRECNCKDPNTYSGNWDIEKLIGAKVVVKSVPVLSDFGRVSCGSEHIIEDVVFRTSSTGKTIAIIKLQGVRGDFTFKDLEIKTLACDGTICSEETIVGLVICGACG